MHRHRIPLLSLAFAIALAGAVGCTGPSTPSESPLPTGPGDPVTWDAPSPWDLSTPETTVDSYLDWVSFSYKMANSEIPTATMTPMEAVRIDSYIQLNRLEDKAIEQELVAFSVRSASVEETSAVIAASEEWRYRYFSLTTLLYISEEFTASYDTTYTLLLGDSGWLVDSVEAIPLGEIE